jgi:peptidoglycan/LPS O-acetylase OafA/YrhL
VAAGATRDEDVRLRGSFASDSSTHGNNFDFLRFCLATLVICSHTWPLNRGQGEPDPLGRVVRGWSLGGIAVDCFFVISGFLVTGSWCRSSGLSEFLIKRARRIYPAFIALMAVEAFVLAPWLTEGTVHPYTLHQLALIAGQTIDLVGYDIPRGALYTVFSRNPIHELNGSLWTIRYEFLCYLLLGALGVSGILRRRLAVSVLFLAAWFAYAAEINLPSSKVVTALVCATAAWPRLLTYFLAGAMFYLFREKIPRSRRLLALSAAVLAASLLVPLALNFAMPICGSYLLFSCAFRRGPLNGFGRFGDFSYGMYLYGFPIQQLVLRWRGADASLWTQFLAAWLAAISAGVASWHLVERRFLNRSAAGRT